MSGLDWQERGICNQTDPELFYVDKGGTPEPAKAVCRNCEVRIDCLEYALANNEAYGVWGGTTERERRALKRRAA
ncbi:WhiB family transcriptional regulator [Bacillus mobilis]|uniref:WhiB family transcriptional regulator n=1 Tax=Bacillati TaxID=1783272 RepID=UPI0037108827